MPVPPRQDTRTRRPADKYGAMAVSFPTPNVADIIIVVEVPIGAANYEPLEYGTPHPTIARAKLVYESPVKGNAQEKNVKRVYATDRAGSDLYNYSLSLESDFGFPNVARRYVVERESYERGPDYDPDPDITGAVMVKEEMKPLEADDQTGSLFVQVTKIFMQLPGQNNVSRRVDEDLGVVTVTKRPVRTFNSPANTPFAGLDHRLSYEEVEGTPLVSTETREDWTPGSIPVRKGQRLDRETGVGLQFSEHLETFDPGGNPASLGGANTDIKPEGPQAARVRVENIAIATVALGTIHRAFQVEVNIDHLLPDELISIVGLFSETKGEGSANSTGSGAAVGGAVLSLSLPASANSSITLIPDAPVGIRQVFAPKLPAMGHYFYLPGNSITRSDILVRLELLLAQGVLAWPLFRPVRHTLSLTGRQVSLSAHATAHQSASAFSFTRGTESGYSFDTGASLKTIELPPTIHGPITIANNVLSSSIAIAVATGWGSGTNWPALGAGAPPGGISPVTVLSSISPSQLGGTAIAAIPTSGLYLLPTYAITPFDSNNSKIYAEVIDMSLFAAPPAGLSYAFSAPPETSYKNGTLIQPNAPLSSGGAPTSFAVNRALPTGLHLNAASGVITGTPTTTALATYIITASNAFGSCTASLSMEVLA